MERLKRVLPQVAVFVIMAAAVVATFVAARAGAEEVVYAARTADGGYYFTDDLKRLPPALRDSATRRVVNGREHFTVVQEYPAPHHWSEAAPESYALKYVPEAMPIPEGLLVVERMRVKRPGSVVTEHVWRGTVDGVPVYEVRPQRNAGPPEHAPWLGE